MHRHIVTAGALILGIAIGAAAQGARLRHINPAGLSKPTGYTHVVASQRGRVVFIAGQVGADREGKVVGKDMKAQAKQVFENLKAAVEAAGGTMNDIAKITTYVTDVSQVAAIREVRSQYFGQNPPASTLLQISALARPEYMIEIEAFAVID